jgi:hypothetical protein
LIAHYSTYGDGTGSVGSTRQIFDAAGEPPGLRQKLLVLNILTE